MIFRELYHRIERGSLVRGERVPTEADLCAEFGVGRMAVRRAIERLRRMNLVETRQGSGSYVMSRPESDFDAPSQVHTEQDLARLFEYRIVLEREAAALAAERREAADIIALKARLGNMDLAVNEGRITFVEDFDFHLDIARASKNAFLISGIAALRTDVVFRMHEGRAAQILSPRERLSLIEAEHHDILDAIVTGSPARARSAMELHIQLSLRRVQVGIV
ncbi:FadR/GntR family transcriptional regulator [Pseudooceanicola sp. C21-150M6]|uniref:FadR/GntR family transcriptional regulator n=1 Tax=Pseudooceanicola sp. C21-150M6 TaxID=3434355 RepID=UPI003D7FB888